MFILLIFTKFQFPISGVNAEPTISVPTIPEDDHNRLSANSLGGSFVGYIAQHPEVTILQDIESAKRDKTINEPTLAFQQFSLNENDSISDIMRLEISKITQSGKNFKLFYLESSYIVSRFYSVLIAFMQT